MINLIFQDDLHKSIEDANNKYKSLNSLVGILSQPKHKEDYDFSKFMTISEQYPLQNIKDNSHLINLVRKNARKCNEDINNFDFTHCIMGVNYSPKFVFWNNIDRVKTVLSNNALIDEYNRKKNLLSELVKNKCNEVTKTKLTSIGRLSKLNYLKQHLSVIDEKKVEINTKVFNLRKLARKLKKQIDLTRKTETEITHLQQQISDNNQEIWKNCDVCQARMKEINYQVVSAKNLCIIIQQLFVSLMDCNDVISQTLVGRTNQKNDNLEMITPDSSQVFPQVLNYLNSFHQNRRLSHARDELQSRSEDFKDETTSIEVYTAKMTSYVDSTNSKIKENIAKFSSAEKEFLDFVSLMDNIMLEWPKFKEIIENGARKK